MRDEGHFLEEQAQGVPVDAERDARGHEGKAKQHADEGARRAWSHEVLPNHRPHRHTEMEYSVPAADGMACFLELRALLRSDFPEVRWPVEYRTLAADNVWLSTAYERDTVTLSVHQTIDEDETPYYRACEALFNRYGGRPHWGKLHYQRASTLADRYSEWTAFARARAELDSAGTFRNAYLDRVLGPIG